MIIPFVLKRAVDPTGISGTGAVAEGVRFSDGTCVVRWRGPTATTTVHVSIGSVRAIHCHGGATVVEWCDGESAIKSAFGGGGHDCIQDRCENAPFASVGGLDSRHDMKIPTWVHAVDADEYLAGYRDAAESLYGPDWETCEFSWTHVLTIEDHGVVVEGGEGCE